MTKDTNNSQPLFVPIVTKSLDNGHYYVTIREEPGFFYVADGPFAYRGNASKALKKIRKEMFDVWRKSQK